jgi:Txe/YoeB family toxin of toxin-antitoxin system
MYTLFFTKQAQKDAKELTEKLNKKLEMLLTEVISKDPYLGKKLTGELAGSYSYRLTYKDRIVYSIDKEKKIVFVERAKTHYGE